MTQKDWKPMLTVFVIAVTCWYLMTMLPQHVKVIALIGLILTMIAIGALRPWPVGVGG